MRPCCVSLCALAPAVFLAQAGFGSMDLFKIVLALAIVVLSCCFHEASHALSAFWMGDPTAYREGRVTLNPMAHIDPFQTVLLPAVLFIASKGQFTFGGAKPVPINPLNFRNPSLGSMLSATAGPVSNVILAAVAFVLLALFYAINPAIVPPSSINAYLFGQAILINVMLAVFNLLPVPPLDGSRVLRHFVNDRGKALLDAIEPFGLFIVMAISYAGFTAHFMAPVFRGLIRLFLFVFDPEYAFKLLQNILGVSL